MKRSNSSQDLQSNRKTPKTARYVGRFSLPRIQSHHRKKIKPRQKNPRLSDYLEEYDEVSQDDYQNLASTSASSTDIQDPFSTSTESSSPSKHFSTQFDSLRYHLKMYTEEARQDLINPNSQETKNQNIEIGNYLWLNLQSFFANRQMSSGFIQHSLEVQAKLLETMRKEKSSVLADINNFKIQDTHNPELSWIKAVYDRDYVRLLQESKQEVSHLLDRYDAFYCLFPYHKAMKVYMQPFGGIAPETEHRIQALNLWHNSLSDLYDKIQRIGAYFDILNDTKRKSSFATLRRSSSTVDSSSSSSRLDKMWPRISELDEGINMEEIDDEITTLCDQSHDSMANAFASMYSTVVRRSLCLRGMLVVLDRLDSICLLSAEKIWSAFMKQSYSSALTSNPFEVYKPETGCRPAFSNHLIVDMNLPSFLYLFLFFIKVPVDLLNQWLQLRSERFKTADLDLITLNSLIEDLHDCLKMGIKIKKRFIKIVSTTCPQAEEQFAYLEGFDANFDVVFQNYLSYLRSWAQTIANPLHNTDVEWCEKLVVKLNKEWMLTKEWSSNVIRGEATAAKRFCDIANDLFDNVRRFLAEHADKVDITVLENDFSDETMMIDDDSTINNSTVLVLCRELKQLTRNLRERALKSLMFLRTLCCDLEISARYRWDPEHLDYGSVDKFVNRLLWKDQHAMLNPSKIKDCNFVILCNKEIILETEYINNLLNATFAHKSNMPTSEHSLNTTTGYVLLIPSNLVSAELRTRPGRSHINLSVNTRLNLSHFLTANSIYLISDSWEHLQQCRANFELHVRDFLPTHLQLVDDFCSCNDQIAEELNQAKVSAFDVGREMWTHAVDLNSYILNGRKEYDLNQTERDAINSTLLQAYSCAFEYYKELSKITARPMKTEFYHQIIVCLAGWSEYVLRTLQCIKKSTPNWVLAPLNYFVSLPASSFEVYLSDEDRASFAATVHKCLSHLRSISQKDKDSVVQKTRFKGHRLSDKVENLSLDDYYLSRKMSVSDRISQAINALDLKRDDELRESEQIGALAETQKKYDFANIFASRKAPFEWQRFENKLLGRGSFGSVYLVMNLRDNCLMAMKQLHVPLENNTGLKAISDEVEILRKLDHPNLVHYYGTEVQNAELLIFMEYCSMGTLARVCKEKLALACVRRYTHYLLSAVNYLHEHNIVHRDIKPANIFLGEKNVLKLGDFGCSFRLQGANTRVGEIVNYVGTTVYCAPELQTCGGLQSTGESQRNFVYRGYGRAVDIWSTGATVLEMLTGKKPFHYLESELQVIFQLGSGIPPKIPDVIQKCELSYSFLIDCFRVNPDERPEARIMLSHPFCNIVTSIEQESQSQDLNALGFSNSQAIKIRHRR